MENPATWGRAEHVIADAMSQADKYMKMGVVGLSSVRQIADALREAGLLRDPKDEDKEPSIEEIKLIHPDYPTPLNVLNNMYVDHAKRVRDFYA